MTEAKKLYNSEEFRDNCGFGLIAHTEGEPSHKLVRTAISSLARMAHRGGVNADGKTGDGCGLQLQKPDSFFKAVTCELGWKLGSRYAVGMMFLSNDSKLAERSKRITEQELAKETLTAVGWRKVPVDVSVLGDLALSCMPVIEQLFVNAPSGWGAKDFERRLFMVRRRIEKRVAEEDNDFYIASLSNLVVIYKGLCRPVDLPAFYKDLADLRMQSSICLFHQRFSTNTMPKWPLAQPFRYLAHNGEINTITGNRQWAKIRTYKFRSPLLPDMQDAAPFINESGSDSSTLDNMLELFLAGGMDIFRAFRLLIPPAWQNHPEMDEDLRAFYDFNSMHMEPWDGPAGVVMSDGRFAACGLDRNGLRPARYVVTKDKLITLASEIGIWDYGQDEVVEKGRVGPGELLVVDTLLNKVWKSWDIDQELKSHHPYKKWLESCCTHLVPFGQIAEGQTGEAEMSDDKLKTYQKVFGYTREEIDQVIRILGENGQEAVASMGDDAPMAVLSKGPRSFYDYFRQKFAQVTNPPIDPLRESHVMSLATCIGREMNVFNETLGYAHRVQFNSPILVYSDLHQLKNLEAIQYRYYKLDITYTPDEGLKQAIGRIVYEARQQAQSGAVLIILSDREIGENQLPIPAAMAVGAVHRALADASLRCDTNIIVETASVRDPHHYAVLIGLGATAIYPYLVYETLSDLATKEVVDLPVRKVIANYRKGIEKGLLKIMSKMGISTVASYRCSQLFELIGVGSEVVETCFKGISSRIEGAGYKDFQNDQEKLNKLGFKLHKPLEQGGLFKFIYGGEYHAYNPDVVKSLQLSVRSGKYEDYRVYADYVNNRPVATLRDLLKLKKTDQTITIDEVEDPKGLYKRFDSAAMSIGALGPEAHEALAIAMNRLGGRSNSGEGGEDPVRFDTEKLSKIKQIASGRFGVTPHYLMNAEVIQIKVAQGAKPGEGGQLPGHKVTVYIAKLRHSTPGVTLISPPPHHDIYSIEDLAQLIFDLKQINQKALVSVKLVSEPGVGTIATGVAKANADLITISGYDGGTGASPLTSVKYAGSPWELGLAETQQALVENGLRHKVRLQVDGGLKTGLDIVKAAILGAESFGFGTGPMVALGCKYLRICHLNNCATGVATQDETLRKEHFKGLPDMVMNYFKFIVQETREIMADLGAAKLTDLIGRVDLLERIDGETDKQKKLDLSALLYAPVVPKGCGLYATDANTPHDTGVLNTTLVEAFKEAVLNKETAAGHYPIHNTDRSVGARLSGLIASVHGNNGLKADTVTISFTGTAGQSFGAWNASGLSMILTGDANDYVGKGMAGGTLVVRPPEGVSFVAHKSSIIGNTCLYGATGGRLFAAGCAGERFAVRNSGTRAVVEGIGDNGCEYMTGGVVTILGNTGVNFGAGMTGGFAYVYDPANTFAAKLNPEFVEIVNLSESVIHQENLRSIIVEHFEKTGSKFAEALLNDYEACCQKFRLIKPKTMDVKDLLGHTGGSEKELIIHAQ